MDFPGVSVVKNLPSSRCKFNPWVGKIPWRKVWQPTPVFLPEKFCGQRSLAAYSPQGHKKSDTTEVTEHAHTLNTVDRQDCPSKHSEN